MKWNEMKWNEMMMMMMMMMMIISRWAMEWKRFYEWKGEGFKQELNFIDVQHNFKNLDKELNINVMIMSKQALLKVFLLIYDITRCPACPSGLVHSWRILMPFQVMQSLSLCVLWSPLSQRSPQTLQRPPSFFRFWPRWWVRFPPGCDLECKVQ